MNRIFKQYVHEAVLAALVVIYILYFSILSFLRYDNFLAGRFDLGNMDQVVWNTIHGRIFQLTDPNGTNIISRLAFHSDFMLVLLSPFYLIWSSPKMLLLLQTLVLGLGAIFVYLISNSAIKNKKISLAFSFSYLMYPALQYTNIYDFHAVTLATTFLLGAFYFLKKKKYLLFTIFSLLAALTKEDIWLVLAVFGLFIFLSSLFREKKNKVASLYGAVMLVGSLAIFWFLISVAIPAVRGSSHFALSYYSDFGGSPGGIIKNIIFSPIKTFSILLQPKRLEYLYQLFVPAGFLSIFSPLYLIFAIPDLLINMLSNNAQLYTIYYQYTAAITPFIFVSAIYGVKFLKKKFSKIPAYLFFFYLIIMTLTTAYFIGPLPGAKKPNINMFTKQLANRGVIQDFINHIPAKYSVAATNNLGAHLSHRQKIYTVPVGIDKADIVMFLLNDPFAQPSLFAQKEMVKNMESDSKYVEIFKNGDFVAFEKKNLFVEKKLTRSTNQLFPYAITALRSRKYNESTINIESTISENRFVINFTSDGLREYGIMTVPASAQSNKFPVLILNHGYLNPATYNNISDYSQIEEYFASQGYLVIKPDYRGNGRSEGADQPLNRFAYPIDVLNLIASVKSIPQADPSRIYLWGHSMGGEVTLQVLEVTSGIDEMKGKIKAADLWAPVSDPIGWFSKNHLDQLPEATLTPYPYQQTFKIMGAANSNSPIWQSISPLKYLSDIDVPVLFQHGTADQTVPYNWSVEISKDLQKIGKKSSLISYPGNDHNLSLSQNQALEDSISFLNKY